MKSKAKVQFSDYKGIIKLEETLKQLLEKCVCLLQSFDPSFCPLVLSQTFLGRSKVQPIFFSVKKDKNIRNKNIYSSLK